MSGTDATASATALTIRTKTSCSAAIDNRLKRSQWQQLIMTMMMMRRTRPRVRRKTLLRGQGYTHRHQTPQLGQMEYESNVSHIQVGVVKWELCAALQNICWPNMFHLQNCKNRVKLKRHRTMDGPNSLDHCHAKIVRAFLPALKLTHSHRFRTTAMMAWYWMDPRPISASMANGCMRCPIAIG